MDPHTWWYLSRSSGMVAWAMLTITVLWGVLVSIPALRSRVMPGRAVELHRWLAGLTVAFLFVHLVALVADSYTSFGLVDLTIPYASEWRPGAVAMGIVALWLLVAIELTSLAMRKLQRRTWHLIHLTSYPTFWLVSMHSAFAGSDGTSWVYRGAAVLSIVLVAWATMFRLANRRAVRRAARASASKGAGTGQKPTSVVV